MMRAELESRPISSAIAGGSIPVGQRAIIHTWGRNDMGTSQILMFHWVVWDPDGTMILNTTDKTLFGVPPGGTEERMTRRFDLNKAGNWTTLVELLMDPDSPMVVDSYEGLLCVVEEVVEEFAGTISKMELEYDETRGSIPVH